MSGRDERDNFCIVYVEEEGCPGGEVRVSGCPFWDWKIFALEPEREEPREVAPEELDVGEVFVVVAEVFVVDCV